MMKNVRIKYSLAFVFSAVLLILNCQNASDPDREIIATVGNRQIDWNLLQRSFELDPKWGKGLTYGEAYSNQMDYLIDQKLYAQAALTDGLPDDSLLSGYLEFIREKEMIKELYRQKIESQVEISDEEFHRAYSMSKKKIRFNYIFTTDRERANSYRNELQITDIESIQLVDPDLDRKGIQLEASFGDLEVPLENVVFNMREGEIRGPVLISNGFMIVQVTGGTVNKFTSQYDYAQTRSRLDKVLFERKARPAANIFIKKLMSDKQLELNPPVFYELAAQLSRVVQNKTSDDPIPIFLSDEEITLSRDRLQDILNEVLITYRDGKMTVGQFLRSLRNMPADYRPQVNMAPQLKDAIGVVVRNRYLAEEARKRNLDKIPEVRREIEIQSDKVLARYWLLNKRNSMTISEKELQDFGKSREYKRLLDRYPDASMQDAKYDLYSDIRFARMKLELSDSLRQKYSVSTDSMLFRKKIKDFDKVINYNPARFVVREIYY